ncbi:MAG TPA: adenylosuccinate synthase, partial [Chloroflexi bacterium]|nr:adenylosuccinate synthase [Chloroflexota bacterium]
TGLAVTKLDVLTGLEEIKICRAYRLHDREITAFPTSLEDLAVCEPVYETVRGWDDDITGVAVYRDLPAAARAYLDLMAEGIGAPISIISVGPAPEETIITGFDRG